MSKISLARDQLTTAGFALMEGVIPREEAARFGGALESALAHIADEATALCNRAGLYGARNVLEVCPAARAAWRVAPLIELLETLLGRDYGLVRGLYFDKPPERSWSLPWHQDVTIAVRDHERPSEHFTKRTVKAGVPHVEAPAELLRRMLTLRLHLDDVTPENGPLVVLPGTHHAIAALPEEHAPATILARAGDVLAMRPLLYHASGASTPGTTRQRRILHLEFAADPTLPDGYAWHTFVPGMEIADQNPSVTVRSP
jgi:hypothetical protein